MTFLVNNHALNKVGLLEANSYPSLVGVESTTFVRGRGETGEILHVMFRSDVRSTCCNSEAGRRSVHPYYSTGLNHVGGWVEAFLVLPCCCAVLPRK